ncbi:beta-CASP ribonuclease aCPSF1 [Candidatus Pacearchaeota archaeon]|nr:beta-CASP ribonuclease aCPSF1 [Candidatus Pacearchaeota archaeon]
MDFLKSITEKLKGKITEASFEGANIVLYTDDEDFFKHGSGEIRKIVNEIKKRIELRADKDILMSSEKTEEVIRNIIPQEAEITNVLFDNYRSIVIIEAKKPGMVIGKMGSTLDEIKNKTLWTIQVQRSPSIKSKIVENIREVLYANNNYRRRFLNSVGKEIYSEYDPKRTDEWIRLTFLGAARQVGRSCVLLQTPRSKILLDCGIDVSTSGEEKFPFFNIPEFSLDDLDAVIISHAHIDHVGMVPYLYKMGYKGPVYMTLPSRDIASLLALDFIGVAYKQAEKPLYSSTDIKEMVKHSICLGYNEVTDVTSDIRITLYNAGHVLGSAMVHINIGNGSHNLLYTGDYKFARTRLLESAAVNFPRLESVITESTYGAKEDVLPPRKEAEDRFISLINSAAERGGKVLIPELGLGRAQETMLIIEDAIKFGRMKDIPVYIDGMIWDINAIHTAYPDFLNNRIKAMTFQDKNPFTSDVFKRVGSPEERKKVIEGGPCVVLATSGMLTGGASVEYLKEFASNEKNMLIFVCYQGSGSLGRQIQEGVKTVRMASIGNKEEIVKINLEVQISRLTAHATRSELMSFFKKISPKPKKVMVMHGEVSKSLDLASTLYKMYHIETLVPRILETVKLK